MSHKFKSKKHFSPPLFRNITRALETIEACNELLFQATDEDSFLNDLCQLIVQKGGYLMVWVGMVENDAYQSVRPVAQAGYEAGYLETLKITWADTERGRGPTGTAIRSGKPFICRDMINDPLMAPWREEIIKRGYASSIAIPLIHTGKVFGSLQIYAKEPDAFDENEVDLLSRLARNMGYGIFSIREHLEREKAIDFLRQSEEQYRTLVEQASDGIFITDLHGNFLEVNTAGCVLLKSGREKVLKMNIKDFIFEEDMPDVEKNIQDLKTGTTLIKERRIKLKDGSFVLTEISAKIISGERFYIFVRDISNRKKLEEELLKESRLESIGHLAGGIAHDFNNLLTGILGNISLSLASLDQSDPIYGQLAAAERASLRAQELASQLLTFSKGGSPLKKEASIIDLIKEAAMIVSRGSTITCQYCFAENTRPVEIDEGQISQVMNNLLLNAIQASPPGGIIELSVENYQSAGTERAQLKQDMYVKVSVKDHGTGIPENNLKKIFDPYFTTKSSGTGLGLATSYSIIKKHGGEMIVDSEINKGTTFSFFLPALDKSVPVLNKKKSILLNGKGKVLLMDDEEMILSVTTNMLNKLGYGVVIARNAAETVSKYEEAFTTGNPFDAVILDLTIPGSVGGKETMKKLLEIDPHVKAIASSGYSNDAIRSDWSQHKFRGFLPKPYRLTDLGIALRQVIDYQK